MEKQHKCRDCRVSFEDIQDYVYHLESKDHVKGIMKNKYGQKYLEAKAKLREENTSNASNSTVTKETTTEAAKSGETKVHSKKEATKAVDVSSSSSSEEEDGDVYPCDVCQKVCTGFISYKLHLEGKKHFKMLAKQKLMKKMKGDLVVPPDEGLMQRLMPQQPSYRCDPCRKICSGPEAYRQHCRSTTHRNKVAFREMKKGTGEDEEEDDGPRFCKECEKSFSGPLPYIQHMESETHRRQCDKLRDNQVKCEECGKKYNSVAHLQAHLKSGSHGRQQRKDALLHELQQSQPEMIVKDGLLGCELCHRVFSGPEAASDHFVSDRHQKALQRKEQFRNFRKSQIVKESEDSDEFDIISEP